ncbi:MAG: hypothetical protein NZM26_01535 [Patescibacteria group bacterium]|nr:hypothetical protein [Patescibacteria group bacterium]
MSDLEENFFLGKLRFRCEIHERNDLLPPSSIETFNIGTSSAIPFEVTMDKNRFKRLLNEEGITGGGKLIVVANFRSGFLERSDPHKPPLTLSEIFQNGTRMGWAQRDATTQESRLGLNMTTIYDWSIIKSPKGPEYIAANFQDLVAFCLAHELGHLRQHPSIRGGRVNTYLKVMGGSFF